MRDIKFRGLCDGEWVYGHLLIDHRDIEDGVIWEEVLQIQSRYGDGFQYFDVTNVGQYTGFKDVTGKEIYEGDIILVGKSSRVVSWNDGSFISINEGGWEYYLRNVLHGGITVVGNVHE